MVDHNHSVISLLRSDQHSVVLSEENPTKLSLYQASTPEQILALLGQQADAENEKWIEKWSSTYNRPYYANVRTGEKSWHHPDSETKKQQARQ